MGGLFEVVVLCWERVIGYPSPSESVRPLQRWVWVYNVENGIKDGEVRLCVCQNRVFLSWKVLHDARCVV